VNGSFLTSRCYDDADFYHREESATLGWSANFRGERNISLVDIMKLARGLNVKPVKLIVLFDSLMPLRKCAVIAWTQAGWDRR
jgi:hypothetical protein